MILALYLIVALLALPRAVAWSTWTGQRRFFSTQKRPDAFDWVFMGIPGGVMIALLWLPILVLAVICAAASRFGLVPPVGRVMRYMFRPPKHVERQLLAERVKDWEKDERSSK